MNGIDFRHYRWISFKRNDGRIVEIRFQILWSTQCDWLRTCDVIFRLKIKTKSKFVRSATCFLRILRIQLMEIKLFIALPAGHLLPQIVSFRGNNFLRAIQYSRELCNNHNYICIVFMQISCDFLQVFAKLSCKLGFCLTNTSMRRVALVVYRT